MRLPKIYDHFRPGQIFSMDEARNVLQTTGNTLRKRLSELAARGYLLPVRQGLYRISPIMQSDFQQSSPFNIACKLTPYCYVGFYTALQFHAGVEPEIQHTIYTVSPTKFNSFEFEGRYYFWCQGPERHGLESHRIKKNNVEFDILVTDFEKSLVDCLKRPAHCPSFDLLIDLCRKIPKAPQLQLILEYAQQCKVAALFNRLGFFFEHMAPYWGIDLAFLNQLEVQMSRKTTEWPILPIEADAPWNQVKFEIKVNRGGRNRWRVQLTHVRGENSLEKTLPLISQKVFHVQA